MGVVICVHVDTLGKSWNWIILAIRSASLCLRLVLVVLSSARLLSCLALVSWFRSEGQPSSQGGILAHAHILTNHFKQAFL